MDTVWGLREDLVKKSKATPWHAWLSIAAERGKWNTHTVIFTTSTGEDNERYMNNKKTENEDIDTVSTQTVNIL